MECIRHEAQLMLACCAPSAHAHEHLPLPNDFDQHWFVRQAIWHGVAPLVAARLKTTSEDLLPASAVHALGIYAEANALRNRYLASKLLRVLELLAANDIDAIALKGPTFAERAYGDTALRTYSDLDILVHGEHLARAHQILCAAGHQSLNYDCQAVETGFFADHEDLFHAQGDENPIDLHWRLAPPYFPFAPGPDCVWLRSRELPFQGRTLRTLGAADELFFLCFHGAKHGWLALSDVCDIAMCLKVDARSIDWQSLLNDATRLKACRVLLIGLGLARRLFDSTIPTEAAQLVDGNRNVVSMLDSIVRRMFDGDPARQSLFAEWRGALGSIDSVRGKLRYLSGRVLAPKLSDRAMMPLPRILYPLYYVGRPLLVPLKHSSRLLDALTGNAHSHD